MNVDTEEADSCIRGDRSMEEVMSVLSFAKLEASDLRSRTQCVVFSGNLDNDYLKLMEVDSIIMSTLSTGDRVVIRGDKDEGAVLCTKDKTFEIKEAETSNSLLIVPDMQFGSELPPQGDHEIVYREVVSVLDKYFELRPMKPRIKKLKTLLSENVYSGRECEQDDDHEGCKYTFPDLLERIQASEEEITTGLIALEACVIDGFWRIFDFDFLSQVLNHVLQLCDENDWLINGIILSECVDTLMELFPKNVIEHIVPCYADVKDSEKAVYVLNEDKICRFFAELTLRNAGKFHYTEFLQVWQQCVPEGMKTSLHQIEGLALVDEESNPPIIWHFPVDGLPEDTQERFEYLFQARKKWSRAEITPYIQSLTTEKVDVGALLLRYSRASFNKGVKVFSTRKTIC